MSAQTDQAELVRRARELYASEDIEIDPDAQVAEAFDGNHWVQAWVWVPAVDPVAIPN